MAGDLETRVARIEEAARGFLVVAEQIHMLAGAQTQLIERLVRVEEQRANDREEFNRVRDKVDANGNFVAVAGPVLGKAATFSLGVAATVVSGVVLYMLRGGA